MFEPYNNKKLLNLTAIRDKIFDDFKNGKLHHSVMLNGIKGIGKSTLAYHLANKILDYETDLKKYDSGMLFGVLTADSEDLDDENPTFNLIKNRKHPDLLIIEKETDPKTSKIDREIKVSSARKINDFMTLAPFASRNKVIIIDSIDEMNTSAQNAILKVLEEPLQNTYIFLVCHNINNVLDTIKSRCREINIYTHKFDEWKNILSYVYPEKYSSLNDEKLKELYSISNGSISSAIDIVEEDGLILYNQIENILSQNTVNIEDIHSLAEHLANNETLFNLFNNFIQIFLYRAIKYYSINDGDEIFRRKNHNFLLKNDEKSIIDKNDFVKGILFDTNTYALNKKHAIVVMFNRLMEN